MKRKLIEKIPVKTTRKKGDVLTVQTESGHLLINRFKNKEYRGRWCIDTSTLEYGAYYASGKWTGEGIVSFLGYEPWYYDTWSAMSNMKYGSPEDEELIIDELRWLNDYTRNVGYLIDAAISRYNRDKRERTENRRFAKVIALMDRVPEEPDEDEVGKWIDEIVTGGIHYLFKNKDTGEYHCSCCRKSITEKQIKKQTGQIPRDNKTITCPSCKTSVIVKKRKEFVDVSEYVMFLQKIDDEISVARHFWVKIHTNAKGKQYSHMEQMRLILYKQPAECKCKIFYTQSSWFGERYFDTKKNSITAHQCYIWPEGISEALNGTAYEGWSNIFEFMAKDKFKVHYNRLMASTQPEFKGLVELLYKGRFYTLLQEQSNHVEYWSGKYYGSLNQEENDIENAFGIADRQKINRIRDHDGGTNMLHWMRWSEKNNERLSDAFINWVVDSKLTSDDRDVKTLLGYMSPEKAMNYIKRQCRESYKGKKPSTVIGQYADYISMCNKLKKHLSDEMVYKPRELKRRHDEAVREIEAREAEIQADEYTERYPGVEEVLTDIKPKYEWSNEQYVITVPQRAIDVVLEGRALHHCVGSCDRYFDRIRSRETYICFLRKAAEPDTAYYTIEVEPGGTIRQHRGYLDEEPDIEQIKPVLREWQKVIRSRMSREDHELEAKAKVLREANIQELIAKNNTRVLEGLMEDLMEAM